MLLAVPAGRLADRIGRGKVFLGGYALLLLSYALAPAAIARSRRAVLYLGLFGAYYAATDGVLMALGSERRAGRAARERPRVARTATSLARLLASILFGALWTLFGEEAAIVVFAAGLLVALPLAASVIMAKRDV